MKNLNEVLGTSQMGPLREYIINEDNFFRNLGIGQESQIEKWLKKYGVDNYKLVKDNKTGGYTIDVIDQDNEADVVLRNVNEIPDYIQFGNIQGSFELDNCGVKSLKGCPISVYDYFKVIDCPKITSLEGCPENVTNIQIVGNANLKSLKGCPKNAEWIQCWDNGKEFTKNDFKKYCNSDIALSPDEEY